MTECIIITPGISKEQKYIEVLPQIEALIDNKADMIANLANISAALKEVFDFFWVGFYILKEKNLELGPFQGPVACIRIGEGDGVCGAALAQKETIVVPDVDKFPGHIVCNSLSKSEIVVPVFDQNNEIKLVLDVDSDHVNYFDEIDKKYREEIARLISDRILK